MSCLLLPQEKLLGVASDLRAVACSNVLFNEAPVLAVESQTLFEEMVLLLSPSAVVAVGIPFQTEEVVVHLGSRVLPHNLVRRDITRLSRGVLADVGTTDYGRCELKLIYVRGFW